MKIKRAIEILDPEHREHYESIEPVNEACRMGMKALEKQIPKKTVKGKIKTENDYCPVCHHFVQPPCEKYCSYCGQAVYGSDCG